MNLEIRKFIKKILVFIVVGLVIALCVEFFADSDFDKLSVLKTYMNDESVEVIYFGDSVIEYIAKDDVDKRTIDEMLSNIQGEKIGVISHGGYHLGIFDAFSQYICSGKSSIKTVVIPINPRAFSAEWDLRPGYEFSREINILNKKHGITLVKIFSQRIGNIFKLNNEREIKQWKQSPVFHGNIQKGVVQDYLINPNSDQEIKAVYIFHYLQYLNKKHRKIKSLQHLVRAYNNCGISVILYITPIDYQLGEKYVGKNFSRIINENVSSILKSVEGLNVRIKNLVFDLDSHSFDHPNAPNEHLNEKGRLYIAHQISEILREMEESD